MITFPFGLFIPLCEVGLWEQSESSESGSESSSASDSQSESEFESESEPTPSPSPPRRSHKKHKKKTSAPAWHQWAPMFASGKILNADGVPPVATNGCKWKKKNFYHDYSNKEPWLPHPFYVIYEATSSNGRQWGPETPDCWCMAAAPRDQKEKRKKRGRRRSASPPSTQEVLWCVMEKQNGDGRCFGQKWYLGNKVLLFEDSVLSFFLSRSFSNIVMSLWRIFRFSIQDNQGEKIFGFYTLLFQIKLQRP